MTGREPDVERQLAKLDFVALLQRAVDLHRRHRHVDLLGLDLGEGAELVAGFERGDGPRMGIDGGFEQLLGLGEALDVIDVGMRADQHFALAEREIHLPDHFDNLIDRILQADVDQDPFACVEDQINTAAQHLPGLEIHFEDVREDGLGGEHCGRGDRRQRRRLACAIVGAGVRASNRRGAYRAQIVVAIVVIESESHGAGEGN